MTQSALAQAAAKEYGIVHPPKKCATCPYGGARVGAVGPIDSDLCIVGEAPGAQELANGVPFIGPSGRLLKTCLRRAGLEADYPVFITNSLSCRPTAKPTERGFKTALGCCRDRVLDEVFGFRRKVVLATGASALKTLTGDLNATITAARGRAIVRDDGTIVVPTLHTAAILRKPQEFRKLSADFNYAIHLLRGGALKSAGETIHSVLVTEEQVRRFAGLVKTLPYHPYTHRITLVADIETSGYSSRYDEILCIGVGWRKNRIMVIPGELWHHLSDALADTDICWVWQNGKFDSSFFQERGVESRVDEDTMLMHYALDETRGTHDLEQLASDNLGMPNYKLEMRHRYLKKKSDSFALVPKAALYRYNAIDVDATLQVFDILASRLQKDPTLEKLYRQTLLPASAFLQRVERRGFYVDQDTLGRLDTELGGELERAKTGLQGFVTKTGLWDPEAYVRATGHKKEPTFFNPGSPEQVTWVLYSRLKLKSAKNLPQDSRAETLKSLPQVPFVTELLKFRGVEKQYDTYIKGTRRAIQPDGRVHSTYLIHGTVTGRLSSRNPNMQNIPREGSIKLVFAAPPVGADGRPRILIEVDYNQAELRVLAAFSRDPFLVQCYVEGRKLHDEMARYLYGYPYTKFQYIRTKAVNFGIPYGRTAPSIAMEHNISTVEAQRMIDDWFRRAPGAYRYIQSCRKAPVLGKALVTPFGRKRRFGLVTPETLHDLQNEASNFPISSTASDCTLHSGMRADETLAAMDCKIVNLVHDSIIIEAPYDKAVVSEAIAFLTETMIQVPREFIGHLVPFGADAKVGFAWGAMHPWDDKQDAENLNRELPPLEMYHEAARLAAVSTNFQLAEAIAA